MPALESLREVLARLIARLDHRWKRGDELPESANTHALLSAPAAVLADLWELHSDLVALNDINRTEGVPLDLEAADLLLTREPGWTDEDMRWWILLHWLLYVSTGTATDIKRIVSYYCTRSLENTHALRIHNNVCPICGHKEPAFFVLEIPWNWFAPDTRWLRFDPDDASDVPNAAPAGGWDVALWGDEPEESALRVLRFLARAAAAGVRVGLVGYGGLMFDPVDDDTIRETPAHGWDVAPWDGSVAEIVEDYGLSDIELERYHRCVSRPVDWRDYVVQYTDYAPEPMAFDSVDDDAVRDAPIHGWDRGVWVE